MSHCGAQSLPHVTFKRDYYAHRLARASRPLYSELEMQFLVLPSCLGAVIIAFIQMFPWS